MKFFKKLFSITLFLVLVFSTNANAYRYKVFDWGLHTTQIDWCAGNEPILNIDTDTIPDGSQLQDAFFEAVDEWNKNPSVFDFKTNVKKVWYYLKGDAVVDVLFVDGGNSDLDGAPAVALKTYFFDCLTDGDILFSDDEDFTVSHDKEDHMAYDAVPERSFQTLAMHELGHTLGLLHENRFLGIMGVDHQQANVNGDTYFPFVGGDGKGGAIALYSITGGSDASFSDWGIKHFVYDKAATENASQPEYGRGRRSELFNLLNGKVLDFDWYDQITEVKGSTGVATEFYKVYPGQYVDAEFSVEAATVSESSTVGFLTLFSEDSEITEDDAILNQNDITCTGRSCNKTLLLGAQIPRWAKPGVAYLGGIINPKGIYTELDNGGTTAANYSHFPEYNSENNATYIPIVVETPPVHVEFTLKDPIEADVQDLYHSDTLEVFENEANVIEAEIIFDKNMGSGPWTINWVYGDLEGKSTYKIYPPFEKMNSVAGHVFELDGVYSTWPNYDEKALFLHMRNDDVSFTLTFPIKKAASNIWDAAMAGDIGDPTDLSQAPTDGLTTPTESYDGYSHVKFGLGAKIGSVPLIENSVLGLEEKCQVEFVIKKAGDQDFEWIYLLSEEGNPKSVATVSFEGWLPQGYYHWMAKTKCGELAESEGYVSYQGAMIKVGQADKEICELPSNVNPADPTNLNLDLVGGKWIATADSSDDNCDKIRFEVEAEIIPQQYCGAPVQENSTTVKDSSQAYYQPENPMSGLTVTGEIKLDAVPANYSIKSWKVRTRDLQGLYSNWVEGEAKYIPCQNGGDNPYQKDPNSWGAGSFDKKFGPKPKAYGPKNMEHKMMDPRMKFQRRSTPRGRAPRKR